MEPRDLSEHGVYEPGGGAEAVAREFGIDPDRVLKLSSNENRVGPSPDAVAAVREAADRSNVYPTASHAALVDALADDWGVDRSQVWLAPGANGALDYLCRAVLDPGDEIVVPDPGFPYYPKAARYHNAGVGGTYPLSKADDWAQSAERVLDCYDGERMVLVTTPHNPTGSEMPPGEVRALAPALDEETLLVVDEAYGEYTDAPSAAELLDRDDVAVLRTLSKAHGLAGLRVGYALVPGEWADAYTRVNTPFGVNELACRAGLAALEDEAHVERSVESARRARAYVHEHLDARTWPSATNFVLADVGDAGAVAGAARERGVVVRDCSGPAWGAEGCIRITCGTRAETERAVRTINGVLAEDEEG